MDLKNLKVQELNAQEVQTVEGGVLTIVGGCCGCYHSNSNGGTTRWRSLLSFN